MIINRQWCMPNKRTFDIKPIKEFISRWVNIDIHETIIDPFANDNKIANITNDLNKAYKTTYNMDALDFLKMFKDNSVDVVLYDPPYSPRQIKECYDGVGWRPEGNYTQASFWSNQKKEIARILKKDGLVLSFGWNTNGIGKTRGFTIEEILLVPHGGAHNDTICMCERK